MYGSADFDMNPNFSSFGYIPRNEVAGCSVYDHGCQVFEIYGKAFGS